MEAKQTKRIGRPPLPPSKRMSERINFKISPEERQLLDRAFPYLGELYPACREAILEKARERLGL